MPLTLFIIVGDEKLVTDSNNMQIVRGINCDTLVSKQIVDFICEKTNEPIRKYSFLYNMIVELMSNSHTHAYNNNGGYKFKPSWYCFIEYNQSQKISFTFLDVGDGIPATVKKGIMEKLYDKTLSKFRFDTLDSKYVESALKGEFRTNTELPNRGKGLPKIYEFCRSSKIQNLRIISNRANMSISSETIQSNDIQTPLQGTLYYWEINL